MEKMAAMMIPAGLSGGPSCSSSLQPSSSFSSADSSVQENFSVSASMPKSGVALLKNAAAKIAATINKTNSTSGLYLQILADTDSYRRFCNFYLSGLSE